MPRKVSPTIKQRIAVAKLVENSRSSKPKTLGAILIESGYKPSMAIAPTKVTESKGFKAVADEVGLTDNFVLQALKDDIKNKPGKRAKELELATKIKGMQSSSPNETPPAPVQNIQNNFIGDKAVEDFTKTILEQTKLPEPEQA